MAGGLQQSNAMYEIVRFNRSIKKHFTGWTDICIPFPKGTYNQKAEMADLRCEEIVLRPPI